MMDRILRAIVMYFITNPEMLTHFFNQLLDQIEARDNNPES